ncbi:shikimate dehydrogenase [Allopseudospirillum japonicum]|uniref:Shikimate dehydrogenase (NADP(+)) n=1 Tax=Allopseudospirillum japonicum TaxID=64971 RepID=A0A1H6UF27_9GAMM|nr:shikimate dehydrogenase [Allopseudospirillum japonicum]SEI90929.1 shikimate dehydrogenase [Allopseudospirillum japonicum]
MDQYAVFGHPIAHSRSPQIHRMFAQQTQENLEYQAILAPLEGFAASWRTFVAQGGCGANVTVPFKQEALSVCDTLSTRAQQAQAVNTLIVDQQSGQVQGDNTDGVGLVRDIQTHLNYSLANKRVLILGAGGAVRGIIQPLLEQGVHTLHIANRTPQKAQALVVAFTGPLSASALDTLDQMAAFDVVINATSASLSGQMPTLPASLLTTKSLAYDLVYSAQATPFMQWAQQAGAGQVADGLGMLVEQAAEAFYLWRQVRPHSAPVLAALRAQLSANQGK